MFIIGWFCSNPRTEANRSLESVPLILVYYLLPSNDGSAPPSLLPPPRFTRVTCPVQFDRILSLFFLCLLSARVCSVGRPPPAASGHPSSVWRNYPHLRLTSNQCPLLVSCPASCTKVPPPDLCGWWYLAQVWVEGCRRQRPLRWS